MESEQNNLSLEQLWGIARRRALWVAICVVVATGAAYGYSKHKAKKYTATAAVAFSNDPLSQQIAGLSPTSGNNLLAQQDSNLELVRLGRGTSRKTASIVGHGLTPETVSASLSVLPRGESGVIEVSSTSTSAPLSAMIANTYVGQFAKEQQASNRTFFRSALAHVNRQLATLNSVQRLGPAGVDLEDRAHTLALLAELGYNSVQVAQEASVPSGPSSPNTKRNTLLGALLGLAFGIAIVFLLERLDRRIRQPGDLERIYRLPVLGTVRRSSALSRPARQKSNGAVLPPVDAETFSLICARIKSVGSNDHVRTLMVASPAAGEGKTVIARHLAEAAVRSGSRVLLFDADLRNSTLPEQLGIDPGPGVADVLSGHVAIGDAIRTIELEPSGGARGSGRTLSVLLAGSAPPPNPGELLGSPAVRTSLEWAKWSGYDLVVIDTPPISAVPDAFPLLPIVDGVVLIGRIGYTRRDAAEHLRAVLDRSNATLLGVIANGSSAGAAYPYPTVVRVPRGDPSGDGAAAPTSRAAKS